MGDLIGQSDATTNLFTLQDGQGSTRLTTDASGTTQDILTFDAFGNRADGFGRTATEQTTINHLYVGELYDEESGLYHLRARDYDPAIGRFASMDDGTVGARTNPISRNLYLYANADPVNYVDPSGHMSLGAVGIGIGISLSISIPINAYVAYHKIKAGADFGQAIMEAAINVGIDGLIGAVVPGAIRFAPYITKIRIGSSVARASSSVWNLAPFPRGQAIEKMILGRPAQIGGKPPGNFPVIDDFTDGLATSIKSIDLTAASYQNPATLIAKINEYAGKLSGFSSKKWGGVEITQDMIKGKLLVVATDNGAATPQQAKALAEFQRQARALWPDISIVIKQIP